MNIIDNINEHIDVMQGLKQHAEAIQAVADALAKRLSVDGTTVYWMGNGGSAADAQHLSAELVGRFKLERPAIASVALHTDSSVMTCLSNDYDYSIVFSRQLEAMCRADDVVVGISTSGNSDNILRGLEVAKERGALTIGLTGSGGDRMAALCDHCIHVPSSDTARIQEAHILIGHSLCQHVEQVIAQQLT